MGRRRIEKIGEKRDTKEAGEAMGPDRKL